MIYKPNKTFGGWVGLLLGLALFGFFIWGIGYSLDANDRALKALLYVPTYLFLVGYVYAVLGAFNFKYKIEPDGLVILWALQKKRIAWDEIDEIIQVKGQANLFPYLAISWPGYMFGYYMAKGLGSVRLSAGDASEGFIYIKTPKGHYGITPADQEGLLATLLEKSGKIRMTVDMDRMSPEEKGLGIKEDRTYQQYYRFNLFALLILAASLAIFFPGSGAPKFLILLLVMDLALYIFNMSNAQRIYNFMPMAAIAVLVMQLFVTGMFILLSAFSILGAG